MPTIFTHAAVPLAVGFGLGARTVSARLRMAGVVAAIVPDLDVLAFGFGIPYAAALGHRGMTHSIAFAMLIALCGVLAVPWLKTSRVMASGFLFFAAVSHALLDSLTNGGLGCALLWPFSNERYFAPWQVIQVSPIGTDFFSSRAIIVLASELKWVWIPCIAVAVLMAGVRRYWAGNPSRSPGVD